jgi:hypothetical protein
VTDDLAERKRLARDVFASLDGIEPAALRMVASGLSLATAPLRDLAIPLDCWADHLEREDVSGRLAVLSLARALRVIGRHPELLERLQGVEEPPWAAIRAALVELDPAA